MGVFSSFIFIDIELSQLCTDATIFSSSPSPETPITQPINIHSDKKIRRPNVQLFNNNRVCTKNMPTRKKQINNVS